MQPDDFADRRFVFDDAGRGVRSAGRRPRTLLSGRGRTRGQTWGQTRGRSQGRTLFVLGLPVPQPDGHAVWRRRSSNGFNSLGSIGSGTKRAPSTGAWC